MEQTLTKNKINFNVPLEGATFKSAKTKKDKDLIYIKGMASTPDLDYQGEIIQPIAMDISYLLKSGWIDYEHDQDIKIGTVMKDGTFVDEDGLHIHAALFADNEYTKKMMDLYDNLQKVNDATGENKHLSFSIEGITKARDPQNPNIITDIMIVGVALTATPANPEARLEVVEKSLIERNRSVQKDVGAATTGYANSPETQTGAAALRRQQLGESIHCLAQARNNQEDKAIFKTIFEEIDTDGMFDYDDGVILMQVLTGGSRKDVEHAMGLDKEND